MPPGKLEAAVDQRPGVAVIRLRGEISAAAEEPLKAAYAAAVEEKPSAVLLNFREVEYINSIGIALIVGLLSQTRRSGRRLLACGLSAHYTEIFHITRLDGFMDLFADEETALASAVAPRG